METSFDWTEKKKANKLSIIIACAILLVVSYRLFNAEGANEINQFYSGIIITVLSMIVLKDIIVDYMEE